MSDMSPEQSMPVTPPDTTPVEAGFLSIEKAAESQPDTPLVSVSASQAQPSTSSVSPERAGTVEHLAARRPITPLNPDSPEIKERLNALRIEVTRIVTGVRWKGLPLDEAAEQMIPLLNVGSVQQWQPLLIPYLFEIDRAGNLVPVWLKIIERGDPPGLAHDANPADTVQGRARRFAILMLGQYKTGGDLDKHHSVGFVKSAASSSNIAISDLPQVLGKLVLDPNTSLYAAHALAKLGSTAAFEALIGALKHAVGWARVDIVEACLSLNLTRFNDLIIANSLEKVPGLESYVAIPIYKTIALENYLRPSQNSNQHLTQQAALIFAQILKESMTPPRGEVKMLPPSFERSLPTLAAALFEGARSNPTWQQVLALHRLGEMLGRYWSEISRGAVRDPRILEQSYACFPMMPDLERWMAGPGREVLLATLTGSEQEGQTVSTKILGELHDPRAIAPLLAHLEAAKHLPERDQARFLAAACEALGHLEDRRAVPVISSMVNRIIDVAKRSSQGHRPDHLAHGDPQIPASIVYGAAIRALGQLGDHSGLDTILVAAQDLDPYVRAQAIEALKRVDPSGEDKRGRTIAREALQDPNDAVVKSACQLAAQYRDPATREALQRIIDTRPAIAAMAHDALRKLG